MEKIECPKCAGQGAVIISEMNDQYDHTHIQWGDCCRCGGHGWVELEDEEDEG